MKLVLASAPETWGNDGKFVKEDVLNEIEKLCQKNRSDIKVAVIIEASASDDESQWWLFESLSCLNKTFPQNVHLCNLLALSLNQIETLINKVDVIWCCGGSTDFLQMIFERSKFDKLLPKLLETKVWVGSSAGSCVLGRRGSYKAQTTIYANDKWYEVKDYLGIINACIYPHIYGKFAVKNAYDIIYEESKKQSYPCYALSDESTVVVDGEQTYLIGKNAQKLEKGIITEKV